MKEKSSKLLFLFAILFTVTFSAAAQIYVKIRPSFPVVVRTQQPSHSHIWIEEDWQPHGRDYRYTGGYWATPPHRGYYRRPGHWQHSKRGDVWIQGSWSKRKHR